MLYLLRHGLDDENYIGGWSDADIVEEGINQVEGATEFITSHKLKINRIYSSDIKRAVTTAKIVSEALNIQPTYTEGLRELDKGLLTGMRVDRAKKLYPEYLSDMDTFIRYPNGESMVDLYKRVKKLLVILDNEDCALLVTHRGIINMIYYLLNNMKLDMNKTQFGVTHASIHELDIRNRVIKKLST